MPILIFTFAYFTYHHNVTRGIFRPTPKSMNKIFVANLNAKGTIALYIRISTSITEWKPTFKVALITDKILANHFFSRTNLYKYEKERSTVFAARSISERSVNRSHVILERIHLKVY